MSVKSLEIAVKIHGVSIEDEAYSNALVGWIRESTFAFLTGKHKDSFCFRNEYESDIEVDIEYYAGEYQP